MIYNYILLILIIILVVLTIFYIFHIYNSLIYDDIDNHIYYMNKDETAMFLEYDEDKYVYKCELCEKNTYCRYRLPSSPQ